MSEIQTLSYTKQLTANRLHIYQLLFAISIIIELLVGLWSILDPVDFAHLVFQTEPHPAIWPRIWGASVLALQFVYIPGVRYPLFYRWPNWCSISIKGLMTIIFLSAGFAFYPSAVWEFAWFIILLLAYYRLMLADIANNP